VADLLNFIFDIHFVIYVIRYEYLLWQDIPGFEIQYDFLKYNTNPNMSSPVDENLRLFLVLENGLDEKKACQLVLGWEFIKWLSFYFTDYQNSRRSLAGSVIGGIRETQEMLDFCSKNNIACDIELIPIQRVNEAYEWVINSDVRYRFVIDMKSLDRKD
jgi:hypothetical protein